MKMDPNITDGISLEANYLVCAATEQFVRSLSKEVHAAGGLTYPNLADHIQKEDKLDFLHPIVPQKISIRKYKQILAEEKIKSIDEGSDVSSSDEDDDDDDDDEDEDGTGSEESNAEK